MISNKQIRASLLIPLILLTACERLAQSPRAVVDRSSTAPTLAIQLDRQDVAYMADHDLRPMIGTGPCGQDEATVWYGAEVLTAAGASRVDPSDALRDDAGRRLTLFGTMEYPKPDPTDGCAYLTTVGYSLRGLVAQSIPLRVQSRQ